MVVERRDESIAQGNGAATLLPRVAGVVDRVKGADDKLVTFVNERPIAALCAALAVGYVIGRIATR